MSRSKDLSLGTHRNEGFPPNSDVNYGLSVKTEVEIRDLVRIGFFHKRAMRVSP